jgi:hypothetical protein
MRYLVRCHNCSHGDFPCVKLFPDQRCPHCHSVPSSYSFDGEEFCWVHHQPLSAKYPMSANFLLTVYAWRGHESKFPNAKLYEAHSADDISGRGSFCPKCQEAFERWLRTVCGDEDAEQLSAPDRPRD